MASNAPSDAVTLAIGGTIYGGWTEVSVDLAIDTVADGFTLGLTERWPGEPDRQMVRGGDKAVVAIGGEPVITGYIDKVAVELSGSSHRISALGRSLAGDLVDCSAITPPASWTGQSLETIAAGIAAPYGVAIVADNSTAPVFARFALQPGETCWAAIERMLTQRGLLGISWPDGSVHLVSPKLGAAQVAIAEGRDFKQMSASHDLADRFATYVALGQAAGSDQASGAAVAGPRGQASDPAVLRPRTHVVIAEDQATPASLQTRANWEASTRAAKAQVLTVTVPGWRQSTGALWQKLQALDVSAPSAWIADTLAVVSVHFRASEQGKWTELGLANPEAYAPAPAQADSQAFAIKKNPKPVAKARFKA